MVDAAMVAQRERIDHEHEHDPENEDDRQRLIEKLSFGVKVGLASV